MSNLSYQEVSFVQDLIDYASDQPWAIEERPWDGDWAYNRRWEALTVIAKEHDILLGGLSHTDHDLRVLVIDWANCIGGWRHLVMIRDLGITQMTEWRDEDRQEVRYFKGRPKARRGGKHRPVHWADYYERPTRWGKPEVNYGYYYELQYRWDT